MMLPAPRRIVGYRAGFVLSIALLITSLAPRGMAAESPATVVVRTGWLFDGTGAPPVANAVIVIEGDRIRQVGPNLPVPPGARVIDLSGMTVMPGFIDLHTHLTAAMVGEPGWDSIGREGPVSWALRGAGHARMLLEAGFTSAREVGAAGFTDVALRNAIDAGWVPGPRLAVAAHPIGIPGGHCDANGLVPGLFGKEPGIEEGIVSGVEDVRAAVRFQVKYGADLIKTCATGGVMSRHDTAGAQQLTDEELLALVQTAHMLERKVAAHAHGIEGIKAAIRAGVDSIEHGSMLDDEAVQMMKDRGTFLVPTRMAGEEVEKLSRSGVISDERREKALFIASKMRDSVHRAIAGGVRIALGTDNIFVPQSRNGEEFAHLVAAGMSPSQAIVAGTRSAAELLGREADVGTVEPGRYADLTGVRGDPLQKIELLQRLDFVMKGGEVVKLRPEAVGAGASAAN
jgi:imidazolonepropionase-like amidohydrolase